MDLFYLLGTKVVHNISGNTERQNAESPQLYSHLYISRLQILGAKYLMEEEEEAAKAASWKIFKLNHC